jgi:hypothetical protein
MRKLIPMSIGIPPKIEGLIDRSSIILTLIYTVIAQEESEIKVILVKLFI